METLSKSASTSSTEIFAADNESFRMDVQENSENAIKSSLNSDNILSFCANTSAAREKRRNKLVQETSFISSVKEINGEKNDYRINTKSDIEVSLSSSGNLENCSSSGTDGISSPSNMSKGSHDSSRNTKTHTDENRMQDALVRYENRCVSENKDFKNERDFKLFQNKPLNVSMDNEGRSFQSPENTTSFYREKLRKRFNSVKERAVKSLTRSQSHSQSILKVHMMMKSSEIKTEELLKKEVNAAIDRHENCRLPWEGAYKQFIEMKSGEEAHSFFTEDYDNGCSVKDIYQGNEEVDLTSNALKGSDGDGKICTSELLGIKDDWEICEFKKPEVIETARFDERRKLLFSPSSRPVSLEEKLEPGLQPRYVEEEGLFVENKIHVPVRIKNKMEQRLLMSPDGRKWFKGDGDLAFKVSSLRSIRMRPHFEEAIEPNHPLTVFKPAALSDRKYRCMDIAGSFLYVLDIDISLIQFSHHPLFSREHVLAQRLMELFAKYKRQSELNNLSRYRGRLAALRKTRDSLITTLKDVTNYDNIVDKIQRCEKDIREVRKIRNLEGRADKELINKILTAWKDLRHLREIQGYQNTTIKLNVKKKNVKNILVEKKLWEEEIMKDAEEIYDELKKEYEKDLNRFRANHGDWLQRMQKKEKKKSEYSEPGSTTAESYDLESIDNSESDTEEPQAPRLSDPSDIINEVTETYKRCFRHPDEPEFEFSVSNVENPDIDSLSSSKNNEEYLRRYAVKRQTLFIKLFYNGKEVCRSKPQSLSPKFNVVISQRFAIRILEWPENLMIEIHEDSGSFSRSYPVSGIYLPFPSSFTTVANSDILQHEFSSKASISYSHAGVGCGKSIIPFADGSELNNQPVCLYTSGIIAYRIGWAENRGEILAPSEKYWISIRKEFNSKVREILNSGDAFNLCKLQEWAEASKLDPNDPSNSNFFHSLQAMKCQEGEARYFRLDPLLNNFDLCKESLITNNARLKLLSNRSKEEPEFRGIKMIPIMERQIHNDILKEYEKRTISSQPSTELLLDPLDGHRVWGKSVLEKIRLKVLKEYNLARQNKKLHEIVSEESVPDLGTLGLTFMKWLRPKRPLRPVRKERKRITPQNLSGQEIRIIVNVVRAFEVPVRKDLDSLTISGSSEGFSLVNVRPFVEISFLGNTARTTAADGANPTWNQDLQIPVNIKNRDFSSANLQSIKDRLYLHLFDEIVVDLIDDDTQRETNIHQRFERHWLASMEIPFSTLYFNSRIEGTFKLYSPPVLLGYEREAHRRQFSGSTSQEPLLPQRDATYITLFATVQPPLISPEPLQEKLDSKEILGLEKYLEHWQKEVANLYPHRKVKTLVMDISGKTVCITRFIKALRPPHLMSESDDVTPDMAARFVSMIPSIAGSTFFPGLFDIWLTADHVLKLLSGDSEDHAVLLCSYFLGLGLRAYVLLGSGIPHGSTAYVFLKEGPDTAGEHYVWDATNGQKYNINDSFCPLQKVYCLFNDQNIWANIQAEEMPRRTKFDLAKRTDWYPAFGKNVAAPTETVQPEVLEYKTTSRQAVEILQDKIEKRLRDSIMKWRKKKRTHWNRYCSSALRKLLPKLEESFWSTKEGQTLDHGSELQHILASHKMCGFPINMAYTDVNAIVEAVKATGVHCVEGDHVEFALSVYVHSYPNDVLSIWIYVASLVRRR